MAFIEQRQVYKLDCVMFTVSCISLIFSTGLYIIINQDIRNLFLLCDIFWILVLVESCNGISEYIRIRKIKKFSHVRVNQKLFNKRARGVVKTVKQSM